MTEAAEPLTIDPRISLDALKPEDVALITEAQIKALNEVQASAAETYFAVETLDLNDEGEDGTQPFLSVRLMIDWPTGTGHAEAIQYLDYQGRWES